MVKYLSSKHARDEKRKNRFWCVEKQSFYDIIVNNKMAVEGLFNRRSGL